MRKSIDDVARCLAERATELSNADVVSLTSKINALTARVSDLENQSAPAWTPPNYSTAETATGEKWIDGTNIYRRVFTGNITADANTIYVITYQLGAINCLIDAYGWWADLAGSQRVIGIHGIQTTGIDQEAWVNGNKSGEILFRTYSTTARTDAPFQLVLIYAK
jgi:hypothetical protein